MKSLFTFINISILLLSYMLTTAQINFPNEDLYRPKSCDEIIDSLVRAKYFINSKQISSFRGITNCSILLQRYWGCFVGESEEIEILYNGSVGYILHRENQWKPTYHKFTDSKPILDIVNIMNKTFAYDSTILIKNPNPIIMSGSGSFSLTIQFLLDNGEQINNNITGGGDCYCTYLPYLIKYLSQFKIDSMNILTKQESEKINQLFCNSRIANQYQDNNLIHVIVFGDIFPLKPKTFQFTKPIMQYRTK